MVFIGCFFSREPEVYANPLFFPFCHLWGIAKRQIILSQSKREKLVEMPAQRRETGPGFDARFCYRPPLNHRLSNHCLSGRTGDLLKGKLGYSFPLFVLQLESLSNCLTNLLLLRFLHSGGCIEPAAKSWVHQSHSQWKEFMWGPCVVTWSQGSKQEWEPVGPGRKRSKLGRGKSS